jgi:hypothetical protein
MEPICASYTIDDETFRPGVRAHLRNGGINARILYILMALAGGVLLWQIFNFTDKSIAFIIGALYMLGTCVYSLVRMPENMLRNLRKSPAFGGQAHFAFTETAVEIDAPGQAVTLAYREFKKILPRPEGLLMYQDAGTFNWVPRSGFATEAEFTEAARRAQEGHKLSAPAPAEPSVGLDHLQGIPFRLVINFKVLYMGTYQFLKRRSKRAILYRIGGLVGIGMGLFGLVSASFNFPALVPIAVGLAMALNMEALSLLAAALSLSGKNHGAEVRGVVTETGVAINRAGVETQARFDSLVEVAVTKTGVLLYYQPDTAEWIPRSAFASAAEADRAAAILARQMNCAP